MNFHVCLNFKTNQHIPFYPATNIININFIGLNFKTIPFNTATNSSLTLNILGLKKRKMSALPPLPLHHFRRGVAKYLEVNRVFPFFPFSPLIKLLLLAVRKPLSPHDLFSSPLTLPAPLFPLSPPLRMRGERERRQDDGDEC